jgi:glycosyltransferase involved in cell wall biosynthesis
MEKIDIIIATKDRFEYLNNLLDSLVDSSSQISQIVIVSSGEPVDHIVEKYLKFLDISYIKSPISNQSFQKKLGVDSLNSKRNFVAFLDDDVVVPPKTIQLLTSKYLIDAKYNKTAGFGLSLTESNSINLPFLFKFLLSLVGLQSAKNGSVLKSGHAQKYMNSTSEIKTQWLNGLSVWKNAIAKSYNPLSIEEKYSAYEDVNFSYRISKEYELLYVPELIVFDQNDDDNSKMNCAQFESGYRMRREFVLLNNELSIVRFKVAQIFRALWFILNPNEEKLFKRLQVAIKTII